MPALRKPRSSKGLATFIARVAQGKQAEDILILDLSKIDSAPSDYFVICTCQSEPQVRAVAESVDAACREIGLRSPKTEGWDTLQWIIVDYFDVVVHVFNKEAREFYKLDRVWGDAKFAKLEEDGTLTTVKSPKVLKSEANLEESSKSTINPTGKVEFDEDDFDDEDEDLDDDK
ncbi:MAG: ribosome silencing factor [Bacteroidota bacterium]